MLRALLDIIFPPLCHGCREGIPDAGELHICPACRDSIHVISSPLCTVCGIPFATTGGIDHPCGPCRTSRPCFSSARAAVAFDGVPRDLIHRFKYEHKVHLAHPLVLLTREVLSSSVAAAGADLLIPVPLHRRRLRERGFNQAVLLGRPLARAWNIPFSFDTLRRVRWTAPQITLSADERETNVRGAFSVSAPDAVRGKRILLFDDVYTTGSTVAECCRVLRKAGADSVYIVTVARAL